MGLRHLPQRDEVETVTGDDVDLVNVVFEVLGVLADFAAGEDSFSSKEPVSVRSGVRVLVVVSRGFERGGVDGSGLPLSWRSAKAAEREAKDADRRITGSGVPTLDDIEFRLGDSSTRQRELDDLVGDISSGLP